MPAGARLSEIFATDERAILAGWIERLISDTRIGRQEAESQCTDVLHTLRQAISTDNFQNIDSRSYDGVRELPGDISRSRAVQGFSPSETATFIFSLKEPLFVRLRQHHDTDAVALARDIWPLTELLDKLGLYTVEIYQKSRDEVVRRQQDEIAELSTPVIKLWRGVLALPLIGTLDSARTWVMMESLLQAIVDHAAEIAIIDITGVPLVDTLVAQHLLKTVAAARLMGADCIINGIRPQIAQTMADLGIEMTVVSKATLADAFALALRRIGREVVPTHVVQLPTQR